MEENKPSVLVDGDEGEDDADEDEHDGGDEDGDRVVHCWRRGCVLSSGGKWMRERKKERGRKTEWEGVWVAVVPKRRRR